MSYAGDHPCSYPASADPQDDHDPYHSTCGNGRRNGQWLTADPTTRRRGGRAGVLGAVDRRARGRSTATRSTAASRIYELGNEPNLWDSTHHDFHPQPTTYDELWTKSRDLAAAVKDADPGAATLGPAEWGWPNYFCSAADHIDQGCFPTSPDRAAHGGTDAVGVVPPAVRGLPAADRPPAARLLRPALLPAGQLLPRHRRDPLALGPVATPTPRGSTRRSGCCRGCGPGCATATRAPSSASASTTSASASPPTRGCRTSSRPTPSASSAARGSTSRRSGPTAARRCPRRRSGSSATTTASTTASATSASRRRSTDQRRVSVYAARVGKHGPLTIVVVNKAGDRAAHRGHGSSTPASAPKAKGCQYTGGAIRKLGAVRVRHHAVRLTLPGDLDHPGPGTAAAVTRAVGPRDDRSGPAASHSRWYAAVRPPASAWPAGSATSRTARWAPRRGTTTRGRGVDGLVRDRAAGGPRRRRGGHRGGAAGARSFGIPTSRWPVRVSECP